MSENDDCHCVGTANVAAKVMRRNAQKGKPWGDFGKQT